MAVRAAVWRDQLPPRPRPHGQRGPHGDNSPCYMTTPHEWGWGPPPIRPAGIIRRCLVARRIVAVRPRTAAQARTAIIRRATRRHPMNGVGDRPRLSSRNHPALFGSTGIVAVRACTAKPRTGRTAIIRRATRRRPMNGVGDRPDCPAGIIRRCLRSTENSWPCWPVAASQPRERRTAIIRRATRRRPMNGVGDRPDRPAGIIRRCLIARTIHGRASAVSQAVAARPAARATWAARR